MLPFVVARSKDGGSHSFFLLRCHFFVAVVVVVLLDLIGFLDSSYFTFELSPASISLILGIKRVFLS